MMANDKPRNEKQSAAYKNDLRQWLVSKGIAPQDAARMVNAANPNATRADIARDSAAHLNALPKVQKQTKP